MKIIKFKKKSSDKYELYFDDKETLVLYEDVIIKNNLLITKKIENLEDILMQNKKTEGYILAIKYISLRVRSKKEVIEHLLKKNIPLNVINEIIIRLINEGYINDLLFAKSYVNDKINLSNDGINKIKNDLVKLDIENNIIEEALSNVDENKVKNKLSKLIEKQLKLKKGSSYEIKNKLIAYFYNLGYDKNDILNELSKYEITNDLEVLKKEYNKLYSKYKNKYDEVKLNFVIEQKLYAKGYTKDEIKSIKE